MPNALFATKADELILEIFGELLGDGDPELMLNVLRVLLKVEEAGLILETLNRKTGFELDVLDVVTELGGTELTAKLETELTPEPLRVLTEAERLELTLDTTSVLFGGEGFELRPETLGILFEVREIGFLSETLSERLLEIEGFKLTILRSTLIVLLLEAVESKLMLSTFNVLQEAAGIPVLKPPRALLLEIAESELSLVCARCSTTRSWRMYACVWQT